VVLLLVLLFAPKPPKPPLLWALLLLLEPKPPNPPPKDILLSMRQVRARVCCVG
jgi:hypothetical protein